MTSTVWLRLSDDPRTAWGWTFRHNVRIESFRERFQGTKGLCFMLGLLIFPIACLLFHKPGMIGSTITPVLTSLFLLRRRSAEAHGALPTVIDAPDTPATLPVAMTIYGDGRKTAREIGWLGLADGWLVFEGLRASVALTRDAANRPVFEPESVRLRIVDGRDIHFHLLEDETETTRPARKDQREEFRETVRRWHRGFRPDGESILPPRAMHPEVVGERAGKAFLGFAILVPVAALIGLRGGSTWGLVLMAGALGFLALFAGRMLAFHRILPDLVDPRRDRTLP